jgi:uncharacterized protein YecT (DUF1311 family)
MRLSLALVASWAALMCSACTGDTPAAQDPPVVAERTEPASKTAMPCEDATDQLSMTTCWSQASRTEEERVEASLKQLDELFASKRPSAGPRLQDDQRRWHAFVEGHCGLYGELLEGGSAAPMTVAVCRWQLAQARMQQLAHLIAELDR